MRPGKVRANSSIILSNTSRDSASHVAHHDLHKQRLDFKRHLRNYDKRVMTTATMTTDGGKMVTFTWGSQDSAPTEGPVTQVASADVRVAESSPVPAASTSVSGEVATTATATLGTFSDSCCYANEGSAGPGFGHRTEPVPNANADAYIGNLGGPPGSTSCGTNMKKIEPSELHSYKYTLDFVNSDNAKPMRMWVWNKSGCDGKPQGGFNAPFNNSLEGTYLDFTITPTAHQLVAFDENSIINWSRACNINKNDGSPDCTRGEGSFGDLRNNPKDQPNIFGHGDVDVSSIDMVNGVPEQMTVKYVDGEHPNCSGQNVTALDKRTNNYVSASQPGGLGIQCVPGPMHFTVTMSFPPS